MPLSSTSPPRFRAHILTCPERKEAVQRTLASLAASDWGESPHLHVDLGVGPPSRARVANACRQMLRFAAEESPDFTLLLEDDVSVCRHLRYNLLAWEPVSCGALRLGSLYSAEVAHLPGYESDSGDEASFVTSSRTVLGGQALLLSRDFLQHAAAHWEPTGLQNRVLVRLASAMGPLHYHSPSLVQHVAHESLWGTALPTARDFDSHWRAT